MPRRHNKHQRGFAATPHAAPLGATACRVLPGEDRGIVVLECWMAGLEAAVTHGSTRVAVAQDFTHIRDSAFT